MGLVDWGILVYLQDFLNAVYKIKKEKGTLPNGTCKITVPLTITSVRNCKQGFRDPRNTQKEGRKTEMTGPTRLRLKRIPTKKHKEADRLYENVCVLKMQYVKTNFTSLCLQ